MSTGWTQASGWLKPVKPGARERVLKQLLYDSGCVDTKALYAAVSEIKDQEDGDLGQHLRRKKLITKRQLTRLRKRTDWYFSQCPGCGVKYQVTRWSEGQRVACPRCKEQVPLPDRNPVEGKLMILKPRRIKEMMLGKLAMRNGFLDRQQLEECFEIQAGSTRNKQLAQVFIDQGHLPGDQVGQLLTEHNEILESMEGYFRRLVKEIHLIDKLVARGLVGTREMNEAIETQSQGLAQGKTPDLVDVLVAQKSVTRRQRKMISAGRSERLYHCPGCGQLYLLRNPASRRRFICKTCGELCGAEESGARAGAEEQPSAPDDPSAAESLPPETDEECQPGDQEAEASKAASEEVLPVEVASNEFAQLELASDLTQDELGLDEPDAADFLDDDFMVSDYLEPMDSEALARYREQLDEQDLPADDLADQDRADESELEQLQTDVDRLTRELAAKKAALDALSKR